MGQALREVTGRDAIERGIDRWNDHQPAFAIGERLGDQNVFAPFAGLSVRAWSPKGDPGAGIAITKRPVESIGDYADETVAWIALLVAPDRSDTIALLDSLLDHLEETGIETVHFGGDPQHFVPGLAPDMSEALQAGLAATGFETGETIVDLTRSLEGYQGPSDVRATRSNWNCTLRRATGRRDDLLALLAGTFSDRWYYEATNVARLPGGLESYWLLYTAGEPIGFLRSSTPDSTFQAPNRTLAHRFDGAVVGIGPLGIDPAYRGRGWGLAMIDAVLTAHREVGLDRAIIDWTDMLGYYEQLGFEPFVEYEYVRQDVASSSGDGPGEKA